MPDDGLKDKSLCMEKDSPGREDLGSCPSPKIFYLVNLFMCQARPVSEV